MQTPLDISQTPLDTVQANAVVCGPDCQDVIVFLVLGVLISASLGWVAGLLHEKRKSIHRDTKWEFAMLSAILFSTWLCLHND